MQNMQQDNNTATAPVGTRAISPTRVAWTLLFWITLLAIHGYVLIFSSDTDSIRNIWTLTALNALCAIMFLRS